MGERPENGGMTIFLSERDSSPRTSTEPQDYKERGHEKELQMEMWFTGV